MYACLDCFRGFREPRYELPNRAIMTMDDNELRKHVITRCPHCGSTKVERVETTGDSNQ